MRVMHMCDSNCSYKCLKLDGIFAVPLVIKFHWVHLEGISFCILLHAAMAVERLHMLGSCSTTDCSPMLSELQLVHAIAAVP